VSEQNVVGEPVATTDVPVAVDPQQLNKPIRPAEVVGSAEDDLLKHKLGLANQHAKQARKEAEDAKSQLDSLQQELNQVKTVQQSAVQKSLEDQGNYKRLWEDLKKTYADQGQELIGLKQTHEAVLRERQQDELRASAIDRIGQSGALNANQLYMLMQSGLRKNEAGEPVMLDGGIEQPLDDYLTNLKHSESWQHHFGASGAKGMGMTQQSASIAPGRQNPYRTGNLTEAMKLQNENPELAQALQSEARHHG
jgi:hypothetical protein